MSPPAVQSPLSRFALIRCVFKLVRKYRRLASCAVRPMGLIYYCAEGLKFLIWSKLAQSALRERGSNQEWDNMRHGPSHYRILAIMLCALITGNFPVAAAAIPRATRAVRPAHAAIRHRAISRYGVPTFADSSKDDVTEYDDPVVRKAAVEALGRYNGSVVAIDPTSGRLLSLLDDQAGDCRGRFAGRCGHTRHDDSRRPAQVLESHRSAGAFQ